MSLDVYLYEDHSDLRVAADFLEENGHCTAAKKLREMPEACLYESNITHNLNKMAKEAGIYACVWRPEENGITKAGQIVEPLANGIELMRRDPQRFKKFDSTIGWGTYDQFLPWLIEYLEACDKWPGAVVRVSR